MGNLIHRKKEKAFNIFRRLKSDICEESFIDLFKKLYPKDWKTIVEKYTEEENATEAGKKHPMPHPDIYMKNMYRNTRQRWDMMLKK